MKETRDIGVYKVNETIGQSIVKDVVSTALLGLCVYISLDSTWWTFVTGLMFILWCGIKVGAIINGVQYYTTKAELQSWVDSLPDDKEDIL